MKSRRQCFDRLAPPKDANIGLWMDKFLPEQDVKNGGEEGGKRGDHMKVVASIATPRGYAKAFERRKRLLEETPPSEHSVLVTAEAKARGRLVVGLGEESVLEVGITLDRTWGVPFLPGSALKGLASAAAHQLVEDELWRKGGESHTVLFGKTDEQGAVAFLDAWWKPEGKKPVHLDVMTVHHPDYYQKGTKPPSDTDSPNPVSFLSTTGTFLIAVEGHPDWCKAALELLKLGLDELGIGAKTNAGYGRMTLEVPDIEAQRREREERALDALPLIERLPKLHADRLLQPVSKQAEWLRAEGRNPMYGASMDEWRQALAATYTDAIASLRARLGGELPELIEAKRKLEEHMAKRPTDRRGKQYKNWDKDRKKLEGEVSKREREAANRENDRASIAAWLKWLDGE